MKYGSRMQTVQYIGPCTAEVLVTENFQGKAESVPATQHIGSGLKHNSGRILDVATIAVAIGVGSCMAKANP